MHFLNKTICLFIIFPLSHVQLILFAETLNTASWELLKDVCLDVLRMGLHLR